VTTVSDLRDSIRQNSQYSDTLIANDADAGQPLAFSIVTGPTGLMIGASSGIITWTPTPSGVFPVTARVTDDSSAHVDLAWTITVVPATTKQNHPPQFVTQSTDLTAIDTVGKPYRDTVTATDQDSGAVLRYSIVNGPVTIDSVSGIIAWTPTVAGNYSITARVRDDSSAHADVSWTISVKNAIIGGLVAWYPFNGNANDESGNGNNGIVHSATLTRDRFGNNASAYSFGIGEYIQFNDDLLNGAGATSVSLWASFDTIIDCTLFHLGRSNDGFAIEAKSNKLYGIIDQQQNVKSYQTDSCVVKMYYYCVVIMYEDSLSIFINGKLNDRQKILTAHPSFFGAGKIGSNITGTSFHRGNIDDVRIYNRALAESEIDSLYHEGGWTGNPPVSGLVAWYPFDGNANDESGNLKTGSIFGSISFAADRHGISNCAMKTNGIDSYIRLDYSELDFLNNFSIAFWMKSSQGASYCISNRYFLQLGKDYGYELSGSTFNVGNGTDNSNRIPIISLNDDKWHFVVGMVYDTIQCVYVDGTEAQMTPYHGQVPYDSHGSLRAIGTRNTDYYYNGLIDDVRYYNRKLTNAEIDLLYHEGGWTGNPPAAGMKHIPAKDSTFQMGQVGIAEPVHSVTFNRDFYMDSAEVTQAEYLAIMGANPSIHQGDLNRPVENIMWNDAVRFCIRKSAVEGLQNCYDTTTWTCDIAQNGYRLPTEAEWEYACRGGTTSIYYWGNAVDGNYCWYTANCSGSTQPVAQKLPNAFGLYDMSGNAWEWCNDYFGSYTTGTQIDPTGPISGTYRVVHGGSEQTDSTTLQSAYRYDRRPDDRNGFGGFRCARSLF
jgi:formylglycine-generating enzyme required for sulfatase activity